MTLLKLSFEELQARFQAQMNEKLKERLIRAANRKAGGNDPEALAEVSEILASVSSDPELFQEFLRLLGPNGSP